MNPRQQFFNAMANELDFAYAKHGRGLWGRHEFHSILMEEFEEVWDEIKENGPTEKLLKEVVQVAAMCLRYAETGDRYLGPHPIIPRRD
jgi:NTP pyrophosphatase (non-canonical NTP hydrolase)